MMMNFLESLQGQTKQKKTEGKKKTKKFSDQIYSRLDSRGFLAKKKKSILGVSFLIVESQDRE